MWKLQVENESLLVMIKGGMFLRLRSCPTSSLRGVHIAPFTSLRGVHIAPFACGYERGPRTLLRHGLRPCGGARQEAGAQKLRHDEDCCSLGTASVYDLGGTKLRVSRFASPTRSLAF